jgi:hypothetical protein
MMSVARRKARRRPLLALLGAGAISLAGNAMAVLAIPWSSSRRQRAECPYVWLDATFTRGGSLVNGKSIDAARITRRQVEHFGHAG